MKSNATVRSWIALLAITMLSLTAAIAQETAPKQTSVAGPAGLSIVVRMQGPYDADVPLQIVCYFKRTADSDKKLQGAPVELDKHLGGVIAALRSSGEFKGDRLETLLLVPPVNSIGAKRLLLIGLGPEAELSLETMEAIGRIALREAAKAGAKTVAFAPMIKDAGNNQLSAGEVETAVVRGMLLAYETEQRLQSQGFSASYSLSTWIVESGPAYYDETIAGVKQAVTQAADLNAQLSKEPYSNKSTSTKSSSKQ